VPSFTSDGLRLHYEVMGHGAPVVLVHGVAGAGLPEWGPLLERLTPRFRCIVFDLRGHGRSDFVPGSLTLDGLRDDLLALCAHERLAGPHVVGFSMGAQCALEAEVHRPGTAGSLVLIGACTGRPCDSDVTPERAGRPPGAWPPVLRRAHEARHGPDHWRVLYRRLSEDWARRPELGANELASVCCPVLVVQGEGEVKFKRRQARDLEAAAPDVRVHVVAGGDHPIHLQEPEIVGDLVTGFLEEPATGPRG
jgi:pimeloyl-ACP methyl ester carboxylesterase